MSEPLVEPPPDKPPELVYYVTTVTFVSSVADDRIDRDQVNEAVMEQVKLPKWLSVLPGFPIEMLGAASCDTVSNSSPTKVVRGFGFEAEEE